MVRRFSLFLLLACLFAFPVCGLEVQDKLDGCFVSVNGGNKILIVDDCIAGSLLSLDTRISVTTVDFYIPVVFPCDSLKINYSFATNNLSLPITRVSYGVLSSSGYQMIQELAATAHGYPFYSSPITGYTNGSLVIDTSSVSDPGLTCYVKIHLEGSGYLNTAVTTGADFTFSGTNGSSSFSGTHNASSFTGFSDVVGSFGSNSTGSYRDAIVLNGRYFSHYGSTYIDKATVTLQTGQSMLGSSSYSALYLSREAFDANLSGTVASSGLSGTVDSSKLSGTMSGTDSDDLKTIILMASRSSDDSELVAVAKSIDSTTQDIADNMQRIIDNMQTNSDTANDIGSSASQGDITNNEATLQAGTDQLQSSISAVADFSSFSADATPFIGLMAATVPALYNFGNGVLFWALMAFIVGSVILFILRRLDG